MRTITDEEFDEILDTAPEIVVYNQNGMDEICYLRHPLVEDDYQCVEFCPGLSLELINILYHQEALLHK
ncbi:MAG: hypothetical protein KME35_06415 [Aphanocapsa sp. GSE-SYN-MK-11-07L]|jgi:hypothetical protein|nr:hypothetical protein [Aphanocapsa sp. GSE-SYN-MK-11-07L]